MKKVKPWRVSMNAEKFLDLLPLSRYTTRKHMASLHFHPPTDAKPLFHPPELYDWQKSPVV